MKKKIVKLNEQYIENIVKKVIKEDRYQPSDELQRVNKLRHALAGVKGLSYDEFAFLPEKDRVELYKLIQYLRDEITKLGGNPL